MSTMRDKDTILNEIKVLAPIRNEEERMTLKGILLVAEILLDMRDAFTRIGQNLGKSVR